MEPGPDTPGALQEIFGSLPLAALAGCCVVLLALAALLGVWFLLQRGRRRSR